MGTSPFSVFPAGWNGSSSQCGQSSRVRSRSSFSFRAFRKIESRSRLAIY